jgi:hypothetical protein
LDLDKNKLGLDHMQRCTVITFPKSINVTVTVDGCTAAVIALRHPCKPPM